MTHEGVLTMETKKRFNWITRIVAGLVAGMVTGAGIGFLIGRTIKHSHPHAHANGADTVAIALAIFYVGTALFLAWVAGDRMRLARVLEGKSVSTPATDNEVRMYSYQSTVLALAGVLLALPVFGARIAFGNALHPRIAFAVIGVLFAAQTWFNVRIWKSSDEFLRATMVNSAGLTFAIGQGCLFLWSAAERLSLVKPVSSWDMTTNMMIIYMIVAGAVSARSTSRD